jgi:hypothetical protein
VSPPSTSHAAHRVEKGASIALVNEPLQVILAAQVGIDNMIAFLTSPLSREQLENLVLLMDHKGCDTIELF